MAASSTCSRSRKKGKCPKLMPITKLEERETAELLNDPVFLEFASLEAPFHTDSFGKPNYEARHAHAPY